MVELKENIEQVCETLERSSYPEILVDSELNVVFANSSSKKFYGLVGRRDGIKEMLGALNVQTVLDVLEKKTVFRMETDNTVYRVFTFFKLLFEDGDNYISVKIEDDFNFATRCGKTLSTKAFIDIVRDKLNIPASDIYTNILFLKRKLESFKEILPYIEHLERSVYKLRRGITNINVMLNAVESVCFEKKEIFCLTAALENISKKLSLKIEKTDVEYPLTLLGMSVFVKIIMDCMNFLYEQPSLPSEKIRAQVTDKGTHWCVTLMRRYNPLYEDGKECKPFINPSNLLCTNLTAVKFLIENNGGNILISKFAKEIRVNLSFPKLFSRDVGAMVMEPDGNIIDYLINNVYAADYAYMKELSGE